MSQCKWLVFILFFISAACLSGKEKPLAGEKLTLALVDEVSGEIAWRYTAKISEFHRIPGTDGFHDAAAWVQKELERFGYRDAVIEGWPSNGSTRYYTYRTPIGWRAKNAELWLVSPKREKLCDVEELPVSLVIHSHSAHVEAELIDVGRGVGEASYKGKDVKGKIVLSTGTTGEVMREAVVNRGAVGVITYYPADVRPGYPGMIRYTSLRPMWEEKDRIGFGFNVSKNQGAMLKRMLDEGQKVLLKADVDAEFYETRMEVLSASLPGAGKPDEELLLVAHLCHPSPSASDNASGSAGLLEMARVLKRLVERGLLPKPQRTIRFLWVPEFYGTVPYVRSHLERTRRTLAAINCDMIGEDLHLTGGVFNITGTPDSNPDVLTDVAGNFASLAESLNLKSMNGSDNPFVFHVTPYSGGSDHVVFNDGSLRVPALMFGHGDVFHHTSLDTPDKVDAAELRRICFITLGITYYLASAADQEAEDMARLVARNGLGRLAQDFYDNLGKVYAAQKPEDLHGAHRQVHTVLNHASKRETAAILSAQRYAAHGQSKGIIQSCGENIKVLQKAFAKEADKNYRDKCVRMNVSPKPLAADREEMKLDKIVPVRDREFVGPLESDYLEEKLGKEPAAQVRLRGNASYEALNFVDGKRSILEIARAVSAEYGTQNLPDIYNFFRILEKAGLLKLSSR